MRVVVFVVQVVGRPVRACLLSTDTHRGSVQGGQEEPLVMSIFHCRIISGNPGLWLTIVSCLGAAIGKMRPSVSIQHVSLSYSGRWPFTIEYVGAQ